MKTTPNHISNIINNCALGSYQANLLDGGESWSGSSLCGAASSYGFHYSRSREQLLHRIQAALPTGWTAETDTLSVPNGNQHRLARELLVFGDDGEMYLHGAYYAR